MEEVKKRLKVYCETTFWSYLNGGRTPCFAFFRQVSKGE